MSRATRIAAELRPATDADLDTLESLVDKSLVRVRAGDRFWMLETIREYAVERLEASGEVEELRRAHAEWFLALAEQAEPEVKREPEAVARPARPPSTLIGQELHLGGCRAKRSTDGKDRGDSAISPLHRRVLRATRSVARARFVERFSRAAADSGQ